MNGAPPFRRLSAYDLHCLRAETPERPVHVGVLAILEARNLLDDAGRLRLTDLRQEIGNRMTRAPELRSVVRRVGPLAGRPLWVDDPSFDVDRHLEHVEVPEPADEPALLALVDRLLARPLDRSRPLWRLWFITGLPDGQAAVVMAIHHALADGLTAMRLARSLLEGPFGSAAGGAAAPTAPEPRWIDLVLDNLFTTARSAARLFRPSTWRLGAGIVRSSARTMARARRAPRTSLNGPVGAGRRTALVRLDLPAAKRVAHRHGAGTPDIVLTLVAEGLRDLLQGRGEPVEHFRPRAGVAVALFSPGRQGAVGNDVGTYVVPLPLRAVEPSARLELIAAERARAARSPAASLEPTLRAWFARFGFVRRAMANQRYINLSETYLPGPPAPIDVLGARVVDLVPIAPLSGNLALSFVALSYARRLVVAVRADADRFRDIDHLIAGMDRAWEALAEAPGS